jgi:predicted ArsR family transcriptional regulator
MVRGHDGAVDAAELGSRTGLHVTTVRFHLDALCDEGAIKRVRLNRPGPGRPRTGYLAVEEPLDYRILAEVLALELGQSKESRTRRAQHAGKRWAAMLAAHQDPAENSPKAGADDVLDEAAVRATVAFTRLGFAPELVGVAKRSKASSTDRGTASEQERTIRLHACPVRDLARSHPEVVCGVHLGLLQGMLTDTPGGTGHRKAAPRLSARLTPFVEPELCVARLSRHD